MPIVILHRYGFVGSFRIEVSVERPCDGCRGRMRRLIDFDQSDRYNSILDG
jgi:hypothetical protein